jgi:hypothetical protein
MIHKLETEDLEPCVASQDFGTDADPGVVNRDRKNVGRVRG